MDDAFSDTKTKLSEQILIFKKTCKIYLFTETNNTIVKYQQIEYNFGSHS